MLPPTPGSSRLRDSSLLLPHPPGETGKEKDVSMCTVLAQNATWADALASICMVMGLEQSLPLIQGMEGVEAYYIFMNDDGELESFATEGFTTL